MKLLGALDVMSTWEKYLCLFSIPSDSHESMTDSSNFGSVFFHLCPLHSSSSRWAREHSMGLFCQVDGRSSAKREKLSVHRSHDIPPDPQRDSFSLRRMEASGTKRNWKNARSVRMLDHFEARLRLGWTQGMSTGCLRAHLMRSFLMQRFAICTFGIVSIFCQCAEIENF